jgi:hypothetical protein
MASFPQASPPTPCTLLFIVTEANCGEESKAITTEQKMKIIKRFDKECAKHMACALNYHSAYHNNSKK